jgi:glycosyltransferase involved in cell wall biosynthesis
MTPVKVVAFPRDPNPYQELLHAALREQGVQVDYLPSPTPSRTLNLMLLPVILTRTRLSGTRILHLHWVFAFSLPGSVTLPPVRLLAQLWFGLVLLTCRALGIRVVWTAHNLLPHDQVFWDDRAGRRMLLRSAAHVIVHDKRVIGELTTLLGRADQLPPVTVVPHGSYAEWYGHSLSHAQARDQLGLPYEASVLLFFGRVTAQKGVEELAVAFNDLCAGRPMTAGGTTSMPLLVIAGRCTDDGLAGSLAHTAATLRDWMRLDLRFVPDDELAVYLAAADAVVLPFRTATTSGSVMLAMTFGRVAVLPDLPAFDDLPDPACVRYDRADPDGLHAAMAAVCSTSRDELARRGAAGRAAAGTVSWDEAGRLTAEVYRSTLGESAGVAA